MIGDIYYRRQWFWVFLFDGQTASLWGTDHVSETETSFRLSPDQCQASVGVLERSKMLPSALEVALTSPSPVTTSRTVTTMYSNPFLLPICFSCSIVRSVLENCVTRCFGMALRQRYLDTTGTQHSAFHGKSSESSTKRKGFFSTLKSFPKAG